MKRRLFATFVAHLLLVPSAYADDAATDSATDSAADSADGSAELAPIVVSASRDDATLAEIPQSTTIVTRQEIEASPAQSLDQLLRDVAGFNLSSIPAAAKDPTGQSLGMRGLGNVSVLVLLDGIPIMDPFYGTVQWYKVPLSHIDHVEVVRGGSVVWGNMAVGGVVNLISRTPTDNRTTVATRYGSFGTKELALSQDLAVSEALGLNLSVNRTDFHGYPSTPAAYRWRFPGKGTVWTRETHVQMTAYLHPSSDLQGSLRLGYHVNDEHTGYAYGHAKQTSPDFAANLTKQLDDKHSVSLSAWGQEVSFDKYNGASCYWQSSGGCARLSSSMTALPAELETAPVQQYYTQHGDQAYHETGFSATYSQDIGGIWRDFQAGVDYRRLSGSDREWIYNAPTALGASAGPVAATLAGRGTQVYGGVFVQTRIVPTEALMITLAARGDRYSSDISSAQGGNKALHGGTRQTRFDPSVSARYFVNDNLALRASANRTFRGPGLNNTLRSYGSPSSTPSIANPGLVPQDMQEREIGLDYENGGLNLSATYFHYSIRNAILSTTRPVSDAPSAYQQALCRDFLAGSAGTQCNFYGNAGNQRSQGVELIGSYRVSPRVDVSGSFTYTDAVLTRTSTSMPVGEQIVGIPKVTASAGVAWRPTDKLKIVTRARYIGRMNYYSSTAFGTHAQGSNTVFDLSLRYRLTPAIDVTLAVNNVFDRTYTDNSWTYGQPYTQTLSPPRTAYAGVQATF